MQQGYVMSDTERDDNDDDIELADDIESDSDLSNSLQTTEACGNGKQKSRLKPGRLSAEAKEDIHAFSTQVLEMADELAGWFQISRQTVLRSAGFGIQESRHGNVANHHAQWYAAVLLRLCARITHVLTCYRPSAYRSRRVPYLLPDSAFMCTTSPSLPDYTARAPPSVTISVLN